MATAPTGTVFDALSSYTKPATVGAAPADSGIAGAAAAENLAAAPDLAKLSELVNTINQQANQARIPGGAGLEQQSSQNIAQELAGNLPQSFLDQLRTSIAQRGGAGGFGVDTPALNAAAERSMGIQSMDIQRQGQQDLTAAYNRAAPLFDVSTQLTTPALVQQGRQAAAALAEQAREANAKLAEQQSEFGQTLNENRDALAAQMGLSYAQLDERQKEFVNSQAQQLQEQQSQLAENARQANMQNAYLMSKMEAEMASQGQQYQLALQRQQADIAAQQYANQLQNQQFMYATPPWTASTGGGSPLAQFFPQQGFNPGSLPFG